MIALIQRVKKSSVEIDGKLYSNTENGFLILLGVYSEDTEAEAEILASKISKLRIFEDDNGKMNLSVKDVGGQILFVSQFTLGADLTGGNRPSFFGAEEPVLADKIYRDTAELIRAEGVDVKLGVFGADMQIEQHNDGPVTIIWDHTMLKR